MGVATHRSTRPIRPPPRRGAQAMATVGPPTSASPRRTAQVRPATLADRGLSGEIAPARLDVAPVWRYHPFFPVPALVQPLRPATTSFTPVDDVDSPLVTNWRYDELTEFFGRF